MSAPAAKKAKVGHRLQYSRACCTQCTFLHPELRTFHVTLSHTPLFSNTYYTYDTTYNNYPLFNVYLCNAGAD